jgi:cell division control protein 24
VLQEANAAIDKETRQNALEDLDERVEEWKSLKKESFGELMLFGTFTVLKGDGGNKDQEKEVCCINPTAPSCWLTEAVSHLPLPKNIALLQRHQPQ